MIKETPYEFPDDELGRAIDGISAARPRLTIDQDALGGELESRLASLVRVADAARVVVEVAERELANLAGRLRDMDTVYTPAKLAELAGVGEADFERRTGPAPAGPDELVLVVNVKARWPEVRKVQSTVEDVVLGDWNLAARDIDPERVGYVLGAVDGTVVAAFAVAQPVPAPGYTSPRVRFSVGRRITFYEGKPSPYRWQRGERYPVVALPVSDLMDMEREQRMALGPFMLRVAADVATVEAPCGYEVRVVHLGSKVRTP